MIVTKTPLRVSFFGGGSDLPEHFMKAEGAVLSTSIDVSMFIAINSSPKQRIKACYDEIELVNFTSELKHNRIRESLLAFDIHNNLEVASFCSIPTKGTGLGSSSTFTVGLCNALNALKIKGVKDYALAELAYDIERNKCNESLGKQDQYAAAFGGFNRFEFNKNNVKVNNLNTFMQKQIDELNNRLLFFFTGTDRIANTILEKTASNFASTSSIMNKMVDQVYFGFYFLLNERYDDFGSLLNDAWNYKKLLADSISNNDIDNWYSVALKHGALGGKILGAGGGGFLMLYVPPENQYNVRRALSNLKEYFFKFTSKGSEVVLNDG
jgi:D-glycero-alpha-D-manno-heptose-7-phosphate kinase